MKAHARMPCHHPKWPRRCPKCEKPADGFNVVVPIDKRWDPEAQEMLPWAWGTSGMACIKCNSAIVPSIEAGAPVSEEYVRALIMADIPGMVKISFVRPSLFSSTCCFPAEEPEKETISQEVAR